MSIRKKLMAGIIPLAALGIFASATTVQAESETTDYGAYTVTIPADVTVNSSSKVGSLNVSGTLEAYSELKITITSDDKSVDGYKLLKCKDGNAKLKYELNGDFVSSEEDSLTYSTKDSTDGAEGAFSWDVGIIVKDTAIYSGTYEDILTFTFDYTSYITDKDTYKILTCNPNGGTLSTPNYLKKSGAVYGNLPTPQRSGYTFEGWYTAANGGEQVTSETTMGAENTTVYAHWKAHVLTINYYNDGAQIWKQYHGGQEVSVTDGQLVESESVAYDGAYPHSEYGILDVQRFTRYGYHSAFKWKVGSKDSTFTVVDTNWEKDITYTGEYVAGLLNVAEKLALGDVTVNLYPVFIANTYTVTYNANGGTGTTASSQHTYDQAKTLTKNGFSRVGYIFSQWKKVENGEALYSDMESVLNLAGSGSITLYAQWTPISYTIEYNGNGQTSGSMASSSHTYDIEQALSKNTFLKEGYTFDGWTTVADGTGVSYKDEDKVKNLTSKADDKIVLYAKWIQNSSTSTSTSSTQEEEVQSSVEETVIDSNESVNSETDNGTSDDSSVQEENQTEDGFISDTELYEEYPTEDIVSDDATLSINEIQNEEVDEISEDGLDEKESELSTESVSEQEIDESTAVE